MAEASVLGGGISLVLCMNLHAILGNFMDNAGKHAYLSPLDIEDVTRK